MWFLTEHKQAREGQTQHLAVKEVVHRLWCGYKIWHAGLNTVNAIPWKHMRDDPRLVTGPAPRRFSQFRKSDLARLCIGPTAAGTKIGKAS